MCVQFKIILAVAIVGAREVRKAEAQAKTAADRLRLAARYRPEAVRLKPVRRNPEMVTRTKIPNPYWNAQAKTLNATWFFGIQCVLGAKTRGDPAQFERHFVADDAERKLGGTLETPIPGDAPVRRVARGLKNAPDRRMSLGFTKFRGPQAHRGSAEAPAPKNRSAGNQNHAGTRLDNAINGIREHGFFSGAVEAGRHRFSSIDGDAPNRS